MGLRKFRYKKFIIFDFLLIAKIIDEKPWTAYSNIYLCYANFALIENNFMKDNLKIAYFGGEPIGVPVLNELKNAGILPNLIVSNPDALVGRKKTLTSPPVAQWAKENDIELLQPESLTDPNHLGVRPLSDWEWDLFIVVAYGKILPKEILNIPKHGTLNMHPSLLPELRGASPIRSAILKDKKETGVTVMLMDEEIDHGPIVAQEILVFDENEWPIDGKILDLQLAETGGKLLAEVIPEWLEGNIAPQEQDHEKATFSTKITKDMSELHIDPFHLPSKQDAYKILLKIRAFAGWPETFFVYKDKRVKIKEASIDKSRNLQITKVIPEGKNEMLFDEYLKSLT